MERPALNDADEVLTTLEVVGVMKRDSLMGLVDKGGCHKGWAEVVYLPGVFGDAGKEGEHQVFTPHARA